MRPLFGRSRMTLLRPADTDWCPKSSAIADWESGLSTSSAKMRNSSDSGPDSGPDSGLRLWPRLGAGRVRTNPDSGLGSSPDRSPAPISLPVACEMRSRFAPASATCSVSTWPNDLGNVTVTQCSDASMVGSATPCSRQSSRMRLMPEPMFSTTDVMNSAERTFAAYDDTRAMGPKFRMVAGYTRRRNNRDVASILFGLALLSQQSYRTAL